MQVVPLVEVTRGEWVESVHFGAVAVVDGAGRVCYAAGDPDFLTFTRSTIKPFQALPFLCHGGPERFGYGSREIALLCASHSGEEMHTRIVQAMLRKAGCDESHLRCGCQVPLHYAARDVQPVSGERFSQLHNNCSGKHAGFVAYCVQHGLPVDTYIDPMHPLQREVRKCLAEVAGISEAGLPMGIDGCSVPNYALPLSRLAYAYARLARGNDGEPYGDLMNVLFNAMTVHPELVAGLGRGDLAFMQTAPGDWVAKGGAEAVQAIGIRSAGLGIAVKVADGNMRALYPAVIAILQQLGLLEQVDTALLAARRQPRLRNLRDISVGEIRPVVKLEKIAGLRRDTVSRREAAPSRS